jgi:xylan 1,4-beta-xylosidase
VGAIITTIRNPILPGFNPDPSICCDGGDYYIAASTFERCRARRGGA